jgi:ABC-type nitrate/sulfonate/bicarbonate transport system permease component
MKRYLLRLLPLAVVLIVWHLAATYGHVSAFLLPKPAVVFSRVWSDLSSGLYFTNVGLSLYRALTGLAIAGVAGALVGILMTRSRGVNWFFDPLISIGLPMPTIAFIPILILWFGLTDVTRIVIVATSCFFMIVSIVHAGTQGIDKLLVWSARSLGANSREVVVDVIVRATLPQIITAMQISLPISLIVALVAEMITGGGGLGGQILLASRYADSIGVYSGIVEIAATGGVLLAIVKAGRRRLLRWHPETLDARGTI